MISWSLDTCSCLCIYPQCTRAKAIKIISLSIPVIHILLCWVGTWCFLFKVGHFLKFWKMTLIFTFFWHLIPYVVAKHLRWDIYSCTCPVSGKKTNFIRCPQVLSFPCLEANLLSSVVGNIFLFCEVCETSSKLLVECTVF